MQRLVEVVFLLMLVALCLYCCSCATVVGSGIGAIQGGAKGAKADLAAMTATVAAMKSGGGGMSSNGGNITLDRSMVEEYLGGGY